MQACLDIRVNFILNDESVKGFAASISIFLHSPNNDMIDKAHPA
jgi:hypothetical protein